MEPNAMICKCQRCDELANCQTFTVRVVPLCEGCLALVVLEWSIRREEFGEFTHG